MSFLSALRNRPFALLWGGQTISRLGDSVYRIALAWWVLRETGSPAAMGAVLIFSFAPMLLFLLIGGVATDRLPRLLIMLASDLARGGIVMAVALLAMAGRLELWHLYVASITEGLSGAFFQPAYQAVVPQITPKDALRSANSLTAMSRQVGSIVGPSLGALLVAAGGTSTAFALDGASFFVSAICIVLIPHVEAPARAHSGRQTIVTDVREGIATVRATPWLWVTISLAALVNVTLAAPMTVNLPFLLSGEHGQGVGALGVVYTCTAAGSIAASAWLGRSAELRRRGLLAYGALAVNGLLLIPFGLDVPVGLLLAAAAISGAGFACFNLIWTHTMQEIVPGHLLGRVASIDSLGSFALLPVGYGLAGWSGSQFGAPAVVITGGVTTVGLCLLALAHPAIRGLD